MFVLRLASSISCVALIALTSSPRAATYWAAPTGKTGNAGT